MLQHNEPTSLHVYTDYGRFYRVDGNHFPGVGTILNATDSIDQQDFWIKWRSQPGNSEYSDQAKHRGKLFHGMVENYFKNGNYRTDAEDDHIAIAEPYWQSVQDILPRITDVKLIEGAVWHEIGCYAGTVDMVCIFDGVPCILDWKSASRPKKPEWMERYPLQLTAYCGAINRMYGTRIKNGVIVVALPKREAQIFLFDLARYWAVWLSRLINYWEQQDTPLAEQALSSIRREYLAS